MTPAVHAVDILRVGPDERAYGRDVAVAEEPLEIRLGGTTFVVIMRTPGADRALAAGFLLSEQIVRGPADIAHMRYCTDDEQAADQEWRDQGLAPVGPDFRSQIPDPDAGNVITVWLTGKAADRATGRLAERRHTTVSSSCGVCGRRSIDDLMEGLRQIESTLSVSRAVISVLPDRLRASQEVFDVTGGLHAAALFDGDGELLASAEDVGRHNAVDKVLGSALMEGQLPLSDRIMFVSGRTSFEIVQKAVVAGVPVVASVSAPSSLAIDLAREAHLTLLGFVRRNSFNVYTCAERVVL